MKRYDHEVDLLRIGADGDSIPVTMSTRSDGGWEGWGVQMMPAAEDEKFFEDGEARILFRLGLFWKRPVESGLVQSGAFTDMEKEQAASAIKLLDVEAEKLGVS